MMMITDDTTDDDDSDYDDHDNDEEYTSGWYRPGSVMFVLKSNI